MKKTTCTASLSDNPITDCSVNYIPRTSYRIELNADGTYQFYINDILQPQDHKYVFNLK